MRRQQPASHSAPAPAPAPAPVAASAEARGRAALGRSFFDRPVLEVAPDLLGRILVRMTPEGPIELRLTEVEAYAGLQDPGSHAYRGRTERNAVMFGPPGHVYVFFTYGMWHCMNLVCGPDGTPSAVLLRAGEIIRGAGLARVRRAAARRDTELAQGPARLATALGVDRALDGADACSPVGAAPDGSTPGGAEGDDVPMVNSPAGVLSLLEGKPPLRAAVRSGPRTGVGGAGAGMPWRFWIHGDPTVSPYRAHVPRRRNGRAGTSGTGTSGTGTSGTGTSGTGASDTGGSGRRSTGAG